MCIYIQKEAIEKELATTKSALAKAEAERDKAAESASNAANSEEIDVLNGQISVMQEVIDSKEGELASCKSVSFYWR